MNVREKNVCKFLVVVLNSRKCVKLECKFSICMKDDYPDMYDVNYYELLQQISRFVVLVYKISVDYCLFYSVISDIQ